MGFYLNYRYFLVVKQEIEHAGHTHKIHSFLWTQQGQLCALLSPFLLLSNNSEGTQIVCKKKLYNDNNKRITIIFEEKVLLQYLCIHYYKKNCVRHGFTCSFLEENRTEFKGFLCGPLLLSLNHQDFCMRAKDYYEKQGSSPEQGFFVG